MATEQRYVRPTVGGWLTPLLLGPWLSIFVAVTLYAFVGPEFKFISRWIIWAIGMLSGTVLGLTYVLLLALVDVALLAVRVRAFSTGKRGWLAATLSPFVFMATYAVLRPWTYWKGGPWTVVAILLVPMVATAIGTRVLYGAKVQKKG
jgi:uncharacterized membrane protein YozB (DUF420 family)